MKKRVFYTELAYLLGLFVLALGTALMERADFGVSMVVAPAYILHLKVSEFLPFFSFGMAEYTLQAVILIFMMLLLQKVKGSYFFSFITAVLYGFMLDGTMAAVALMPFGTVAARILFYVLGMLLCTAGVSLLFHTYISPEAYELFVKEISAKFNLNIHRCKTAYDCVSCLLAVLLSFLFFGFGHFEGIGFGTILCAVVNGSIIHLYTRIFETIWTFEDRLPFKKYF